MAYTSNGLGASVFGLHVPFTARPVSADTVATRRLALAARAKANARRFGTPTQRAATTRAFYDAAANRTEEVARERQAETPQPGFFDRLRDVLTGAGKWAAIGIGVLVVAPLALGAVRRARANPHRRRRRGR